MNALEARLNPDLTPPARFSYITAMKALIQTGSSWRLSVPPEKRFLTKFCLLVGMVMSILSPVLRAQHETLWIEAEHLDGIRGYCWPMASNEARRQTDGHWALSGPGWAAEWTQGGESGFLSIAAGADDDRAVAGKRLQIPRAGRYFVWVRYGDWREAAEPFEIRIEQQGRPTWTGEFGRRPMIGEDNVMKLYWNWAFVWDSGEVELDAGEATLYLQTTQKAANPRQIDVIVLTTDASYRPLIKDRPSDPAWQILDSWRENMPKQIEPLAARRGWDEPPASWRPRTFADEGFLYLWNIRRRPMHWLLSDDENRVPVPYQFIDTDVREAFEAEYAGRTDVPIFGDARIVPTFRGVGAAPFVTDGAEGEVLELGVRLAAWLDADPERKWATMMNYHRGAPIGPKGQAMFARYRDRYVGGIAGESLGYFHPDRQQMQETTAGARTRRELVEAFTPLTLEANAEKYRQVYGGDFDENPYEDVISCKSVGSMAFAPLISLWGARTIGYESAAATSSILNMRWAFMRGIARQGGHLTASYRSCNFGDAATMFSNAQSYTSVQNILDNYYNVYAGAGMTWYKFDIWYQYMAGSSMFYHEQGFDEYWMPGGTTAAGRHPLQLSPKGKLVDRFLRLTDDNFERGTPYTPVAFLVDYAHGWEPAPYWPNSFKNWHRNPDTFTHSPHEQMLQNYFWVAYHPIGPESEKPINALNEVYLPGVFGDIFDVICAYPEVERWTTIDTYPVVIAAGEIELTEAEGRRLAQYVEAGGTLLVADAHLSGPGVAALQLPLSQPQRQANRYRWMDDDQLHSSGTFRYRPILAEGGRALATTPDGDVFCAAFDRGQGRLVVLSVPHGTTIGGQVSPVLAHVMAHLTRGLLPIEVAGDVQWMLNRTSDGWNVTLLNPAGDIKPQHGMFPTDYRENREVTIHAHVPIRSAYDRLLPDDPMQVRDNRVRLTVPAGEVRIIALTEAP